MIWHVDQIDIQHHNILPWSYLEFSNRTSQDLWFLEDISKYSKSTQICKIIQEFLKGSHILDKKVHEFKKIAHGFGESS